MKLQCFTCLNKKSTLLTQEQRIKMREEEKAKGIKYPDIPEMIFHCEITNERIKQIDPACENYSEDKFMAEIRVKISEHAKKMLKELRNEN